VVFPQTKLLYVLSPCKHTKNLLSEKLLKILFVQRSKSYTFTVWLNYSRCSGEVVRSFEAEANTNELCLHPEDNNVFIAAESSFGAVTQFDLRTPAGMISSDSKQRDFKQNERIHHWLQD
jgi:hypothetical protein